MRRSRLGVAVLILLLTGLTGVLLWGRDDAPRHWAALSVPPSNAPATPAPAPAPAPAVAEPQSPRLRGVVVSEQAPVKGAVVTLELPAAAQLAWRCGSAQGCLCDGTFEQRVADLFAAQLKPQVAAQAITTADGRFEFERQPGEHWLLRAEQGGRVAAEAVPTANDELTLRLHPFRAVTGQTVDENGTPIPKARVVFLDRSLRASQAVSGPDGRFRIERAPSQEVLAVAFTETAAVSMAVLGNPLADLRLELTALRRVSGEVRREGKPATGWDVQVRGGECSRLAVTDGRGQFTLKGLLPGDYEFIAARGLEVGIANETLRRDEDLTGVQVVVHTGGVIEGRVATGEAVAVVGAIVNATTSNVEPSSGRQEARTDKDGRYRLGPLAAGEWVVAVRSPRFATPQAATLPVATGETVVHDFLLTAGAKVRGILVSSDGSPIPRGTLTFSSQLPTATPLNEWEAWLQGEVRSAADGRFVFEGLRPGPWKLAATAPGYIDGSASFEAPADGLRVVLSPGGQVRGLVRDSAGRPAHALVMMHSSALPPAARGEPEAGSVYDSAATAYTRGGEFKLGWVADGEYVITAQLGTWPHAERTLRRTIEVRDGGAPFVELRFEAEPGAAGRVVDESGAPLPGVEVTVWVDPHLPGAPLERPEYEALSAVTDVDGAFTLANLPAGNFRVALQVGGERLEAGDAQLRGGGPPVTILVRDLRRLVGRVVDEQGEPMRSFQLNSRPHASEDGSFLQLAQKGGSTRLRFAAAGLADRELTVPPGPKARVDLGNVVLQRGRSVRGRVVDAATGAAVAGARLVVEDLFEVSTVSSATGEFEIEGAPLRPLKLVVTHRSYPKTVVPVANAPDFVTVKVALGGVIEGAVDPASGESPTSRHGSTVEARSEDPDDSYRAPVDASGRFRIEGLPPGKYRLSILRGSVLWSGDTVWVESGRTVRFDFHSPDQQ